MSEPDTAPRLSEERIIQRLCVAMEETDPVEAIEQLEHDQQAWQDACAAIKAGEHWPPNSYPSMNDRWLFAALKQEVAALKAERDTLSEAWTEAREIAGRSIAKRLEAEAERDTLLRAARDCPTHGDPLVCLACEADEQALPVWQRPRRVMPPRLGGEPERIGEERLRHQAICISEMLRHAGVGSGTLTEGVQELSRRTEAATEALVALRAQVEQTSKEMRACSRYKSHPLGFEDSVADHRVDDWADELEAALLASQPGPATQEPNP